MSKVYLKSVILGDGAIGKTSLLWTYENNGVFRNHYIPPSVDDVAYDSEDVHMTFWDTAWAEDYDRLNPLCHPQTDVFLLCFSLSCKEFYSHVNIIQRWYPEVTLHCPNTPIILVGTKLDLRDNEQYLYEHTRFSSLTTEEGIKLSEDIGAVKYMECSSLQNEGVNEVIEAAVEVGLKYKSGSNKYQNSKSDKFLKRCLPFCKK